MKFPFVSLKKYEELENENFSLKRRIDIDEKHRADTKRDETLKYLEVLRERDALQEIIKEKEETLNIYRVLLKNVADGDAIKKILENEQDLRIKRAKEMTEKGMFGGSL